MMQIDEFEFHCTCDACPEQYDVYKDGINVGYVRVRWGKAHLFPVLKITIDWDHQLYEAVIGSGFTGCFETDADRHTHLHAMASVLRNYLTRDK